MHRRMDDDPVTEDDINELKGDVSSLRYELLEVFEKNGMDVSFTDRKEKSKYLLLYLIPLCFIVCLICKLFGFVSFGNIRPFVIQKNN